MIKELGKDDTILYWVWRGNIFFISGSLWSYEWNMNYIYYLVLIYWFSLFVKFSTWNQNMKRIWNLEEVDKSNVFNIFIPSRNLMSIPKAYRVIRNTVLGSGLLVGSLLTHYLISTTPRMINFLYVLKNLNTCMSRIL